MKKEVLVEVSARHIHLSQEHLELLFGPGYKLSRKKDLSQPGQYACEERLDIVGPKGRINNVVILGPTRPATQIEISLTDARVLGLTALVRESGDIAGSCGCTLVGPGGEITIDEGLIAAKRHIHVNGADSERLGLVDKDIIGVRIEGSGRTLVFYDVIVRVSDNFATAVHIDTDEANAANFSFGFGEIVK